MPNLNRTGGNGEDAKLTSAVPIPVALTSDSAEWLQVTLSCIGDGVITTDREGRVTFLNPIAQALTGWTLEEAVASGGVAIGEVFNIVNEATRAPLEKCAPACKPAITPAPAREISPSSTPRITGTRSPNWSKLRYEWA